MDERSRHLLQNDLGTLELESSGRTMGVDSIDEKVSKTIKLAKVGAIAVVLMVYGICWLAGLTKKLKGMNPAESPRCVVDLGLDWTLDLTLVVWSDPMIRWSMKVLSSFMIDATFIASMAMV